MKKTHLYAATALFAISSIGALAQSSITSLAEYKKKQDDGIAESVRASQTRGKAGRLGMMNSGAYLRKGGQMPANRPAIIKLAHPPRQVGVDNRRGTVVR